MPPALPSRRLVRCCVAALAAVTLASGALAAQSGVAVAISPALPTSSDSLVLVVAPTCLAAFEPPTVAGNTITLTVGPPIPAPCPVAHLYPLGPLAAGSYTVKQVAFDGSFLSSSVFQVNLPASQLGLIGGRFIVTATWSLSGGASQPSDANAVQLADGAGYFWFFDAGSPELSVKVLDGTAINGSFWVFIASSTTVAFDLTVTDTLGGCAQPGSFAACFAKTYRSTAGTNQNIFDLGTFTRLTTTP